MLTSGAVRATENVSEARAFESSRVSESPVPAAPLAPVEFGGAGITIMRFEPKPATKLSTCCDAPRPIATIVITAPTPIIIPNIVSRERVLLLMSERNAVLKISML